MTTGSSSIPWPRLLAAGAATVALHAMAARWMKEQLAQPGVDAAPQAVVQLRFEQPAPAPAPAMEPAPPMRRALAAPQAVELKAVPAVGYRVALPPPAQLVYDVTRDGVPLPGEALLEWRPDGGRYQLRWLHSAAVLESEGTLGAAGIAPRTAREQRRGRAQTATHFDAEKGRITFSASQAVATLEAGTQDRASFLMQLAGMGRADGAQLQADIAMLVGAERDAQAFRFTLAGAEDIETAMGRIATWRLVRPTPPGSWHARLDIWLAPGHDWYPVQLRSTEANGVVTTHTIRRIVTEEN